ncbi:MAG TPA: NAD kinase [Porphyromonadaceae bacterium]|nr:NAD kinase [Porphyromonadaceae bacterium]
MKLALFGSTFTDRTAKAEEQIYAVCRAIKQYPCELFLPSVFYHSLPQRIRDMIRPLCELFEKLPCVDMAVSVGGDGTFLRTAGAVGAFGIPVLGINTGRLGFLAAINFGDVEETLKEIMSGHYRIENRTLLEMTAEDNPTPFGYSIQALNEVAILKQDTASMLTIHAYINDDYLTSYQADGLVIATPTGSTAYSLSIGGAILSPTTPSLILSAIAPHNLTSRSLVVDDNSKIRLKVESRSRNFLVSLDGQSQVFHEDTALEVRKADYMLKVVKRISHSFYATLRDKLMWGKDVRKQNG